MAFTQTITAQTTIFTPPADCSRSWTYEGAFYNSIAKGLLMQNLLQGQIDKSCFPESFNGFGRAPSSIQVYSPGACPSGYATPGAFNNAGTTTAICCPSNFSYYSTFSSIAHFTSSSVLFQGCISTLRGTTTVSARTGNTDLTSTVVTGPLTMWGQPIMIQYQDKDLSLFATTSSTSSSTSAASTSSDPASISATGGSSNTNATFSTGSSFPVWARAVTGVGVVLGVLLLAGLAWFFIRRHRRQKQTLSIGPPIAGPYGYTPGQPPYHSQATMVQNAKSTNGMYEFYNANNNNGASGRRDVANKPLPTMSPRELDGTSTPGGSVYGGTVTGSVTSASAVGGTGTNSSNAPVKGSWLTQPLNRNSRAVELE